MKAARDTWLGDPVDLAGTAALIVGIAIAPLAEGRLGAAAISLGLFGPWLLREARVFAWRDDFQREVHLRAGMHALLAVGLIVTAVMVTQGAGGSGSADLGWDLRDRMSASTVLVIMATTWICSRVMQFWGPLTGARRFLVFMAAAGLFGLAHTLWTRHVHGLIMPLRPLLISCAQVGWLGLLFFTVPRRPRLVGWLLAATLATMTPDLVRCLRQDGGEPAWAGAVYEICMLLPLLLSAVALVGYREREQD